MYALLPFQKQKLIFNLLTNKMKILCDENKRENKMKISIYLFN